MATRKAASTMRVSVRPSWVLLAVLALAACHPVLPAAPQPSPPSPVGPAATAADDVGAQALCPAGSAAPEPTPTPTAPVEYVATVEQPGPSDEHEYVTFTAASEAELDAEVAQLEAEGDVLTVEPNRLVSALLVDPSDDDFFASGQQYGPKLAHADFETAWASGLDGTGVRIAIVDSGVVATHEDLLGRVDIASGWDFVEGNLDATDDDHGHGTHVAGIAAASDNSDGVVGGAPLATIVPIRVLNAQGSGGEGNVASGIAWAANPLQGNADIINLSLGGPSCSQAIQNAIQAALTAGLVVVAAGGNCGAGPNTNCDVANQALFPAAGPDTDLIAVAATTEGDERASFSNFNPRKRVSTWPQVLGYIDVAAPGNQTISTYVGSSSAYQFLSGTSMASPHVAAAAALLLQKCPSLFDHGATTSADVKAMLEATAVRVYEEAISSWPTSHTTNITDLGHGLIKVGAATALPCPA
ncbi:MAG: S8 family serine peptidase [Acidimicrobiia bacterium]